MSIAGQRALVPLLVAMALAGIVAGSSARPAYGAVIIVVDTAVDEDVDNARCSLREAIIAANTNASYHGCAAPGAGVNDTIAFSIGPGTPAINISTTPLPPITQWVTIDGGDGRVELHGPGGPPVSGHHGLTVTHDGFGTIIRNLVINNFSDDGIRIEADEVDVFGCFIGTDATGTTAVPNQGFGVQVFGGNGAHIGGATSGGSCSGTCNLISGATNDKADILLDLNATGALVRGNFIGTDVTGTVGIANNATGIIDKGGGDRIGGANGTTPGGPCTGDCNLISGNSGFGGILVDQAATGSIIQGNFVGPDVTGTQAIDDIIQVDGVAVRAAGVLIGGTIAEARNVVSGNFGAGIALGGASATVQGNYVGTNAMGTDAVPDSGTGVYVVQANGAMIGGPNPGAGNLISGASTNASHGVWIEQSTNTQLRGNFIGTAADGTTPLPNRSDGVYISDQSSNNTVGGQAAAANTIAFNGLWGVSVDGGIPPVRGNAIRGNSIYENDDGGIELLEGGNDDLAPPTIDGFGPLHGTACAPCTVEIFSDFDGQGRVFQGSVLTNDGNWTFDAPVSGPEVTATNTDMSNNTSEFSAPFSLPTPTPSPTDTMATATATATRSPTASFTHTATATATRTGTPTALASPPATGTPTPTAAATSSRTATVTATAMISATSTTTQTATTTLSPAAPSTDTPTPVSSPTPLATPTPSTNSTPPATPVPCTGDCNDTHTVSINELITGVNIVLGNLPVGSCPAFENAEGMVDIAQLVRAVSNTLDGCPS